MDFVNYYAVLNLPKTARTRDVQKAFEELLKNNPAPDRFDVATKAYATLSNRYKRARYDRTIGHLMVIQITPQEYPSATCYQLNSIQPYTSLLSLIEKFKNWIEKKYDFDWKEAQLAGFSYHLHDDNEKSYLMLRLASDSAMRDFAKYLDRNRLIKSKS